MKIKLFENFFNDDKENITLFIKEKLEEINNSATFNQYNNHITNDIQLYVEFYVGSEFNKFIENLKEIQEFLKKYNLSSDVDKYEGFYLTLSINIKLDNFYEITNDNDYLKWHRNKSAENFNI